MSAQPAAIEVPARVAIGPELAIDLAAIAANTALLRRSSAALMAVVKADGYGLGAAQVARTALAHGASCLGVTSIGEALALRREGVLAPILSWLNPVDAPFDLAIAGRIDLAVGSRAHLDRVCRAAGFARRAAQLHLAVDTGMGREGCPADQWTDLVEAAASAERAGLIRVVGLMGHLTHAEEPAHFANRSGKLAFRRAVFVARGRGLRPRARHLATTAATLTDPESRHTLSRVGAGLVGIDPSGRHELAQPLTLTAPVVAARELSRGTGAGYDHAWRAPRHTRVITLPVGYADGIPRAAAGRAHVLVRGRRCPLVGRVSMDQVLVDVGEAPVAVGERVTLLGADGPTLAEWARWADTIPHEIVTGFGHRIARTYRGVR